MPVRLWSIPVVFSFPDELGRMASSGDLSAQMETALMGLEMLARTSLSTSILLVVTSRKSGSNLSARVEGLVASGW